MDKTHGRTAQLELVHAMPELHADEANQTLNAKARDSLAHTLLDLGAGPVVKTVVRVFDFIEIASKELDLAAAQRPERAEDIKKAFCLLCWQGDHLPLPTDEVYRSHAREIIGRVINGRKAVPGTKAEALMALSQASLKAPLNQTGLCAMQHLYADVMEMEDMEFVPEPYKGAAQELIGALITKLSVDSDVSKLVER